MRKHEDGEKEKIKCANERKCQKQRGKKMKRKKNEDKKQTNNTGRERVRNRMHILSLGLLY